MAVTSSDVRCVSQLFHFKTIVTAFAVFSHCAKSLFESSSPKPDPAPVMIATLLMWLSNHQVVDYSMSRFKLVAHAVTANTAP